LDIRYSHVGIKNAPSGEVHGVAYAFRLYMSISIKQPHLFGNSKTFESPKVAKFVETGEAMDDIDEHRGLDRRQRAVFAINSLQLPNSFCLSDESISESFGFPVSESVWVFFIAVLSDNVRLFLLVLLQHQLTHAHAKVAFTNNSEQRGIRRVFVCCAFDMSSKK
jgi:hypothetical protein